VKLFDLFDEQNAYLINLETNTILIWFYLAIFPFSDQSQNKT